MLNEVEFKDVQESITVDKVKIVACDGHSKLSLIFSTCTCTFCHSCMNVIIYCLRLSFSCTCNTVYILGAA